MSPVPLLLTLDLEVAPDHDLEAQAEVLRRLRADCADLPLTIFATADAAARFETNVVDLVRSGHEVGCHGEDHSKQENYRLLSPPAAQAYLQRATVGLTRVLRGHQDALVAFRGPCWTTSRATQRSLVELGYRGDFSVCAQRLDFLTCSGGHLGWLTAPRRAYRPSVRSPYRRGRRDAHPLWVVPMVTHGAPFMSGMLYLLGLPAMKAMFAALLAEARRTGAPIVYLFHSYEFAPWRRGASGAGQSRWHRLYARDRAWRYTANLALLRHLAQHPLTMPITASGYLDALGEPGS